MCYFMLYKYVAMQQLHLFRILITPSPLSVVATFVLSIAWIAFASWLSASDNQLVYQSVFGSQILTAQAWSGTDSAIEWITKFFSSTTGYYIFLIMFGLFIGVAVFTLIKTFSHIGKGVMSFIQSSEDASQSSALFEIFTQLWVRSATLIGWALFIAIAVNWIAPLLNSLIDTGLSHLGNFSFTGVLFYVLALLIGVATLHMHIVFVRLFLLRPRVFGRNYI